METINGEWIMKGCDPDDPLCLKTAEEAAELIRLIGFLPLFSNDVEGFSIEERTESVNWWKDDPSRDPWAWRQILAREPDVFYGKFFARRAGFVSSEWFPRFANYRRNGCDFDTLIDEGLAPFRAQKLMRPFLTDGMPNGASYHSFRLKDLAGFGKNGEKNFEGVLTDLEMQTFLCISDFRQRLNKAGLPYGWHIAVIECPESKLGCEQISSAYQESPSQSWMAICDQIRRFFPHAQDAQLQKWLG